METTNINKEAMVVTARDYDIVLKSLRLPAEYLVAGKKVLSIGEGLSNFARQLGEKNGMETVAVDPIYSIGSGILEKDPEEEKEL